MLYNTKKVAQARRNWHTYQKSRSFVSRFNGECLFKLKDPARNPGPEPRQAVQCRPALSGEEWANPSSVSLWDSAVNFLQHTS